MAPPSPNSLEQLLEQASWLRGLARTLVGDGPRADDLSQETWLRALEQPPREPGPLRGWLATIMRNLVRQEHRGQRRREEREERVARPEAQPSTLELVDRATTQRELVAAVLELDEPYRSTLLLRYFEGCTPTAIARREGVPLSTVKTRLARGLERLRAGFGERHGGSEGGAFLSLVALAGPPLGSALPPVPGSAPSTLPLTLGALAVNAKLVLPLTVLVLAAGASYFVLGDGERGETPTLAADGGVELAPPARVDLRTDPARAGEVAPAERVEPRSSAAPAALSPTVEPEVAAAPAPVLGRVVDLEARGLLGVRVGYGDAPEGATATSGPDGTFELAPAAGGQIVAMDPTLATVFAARPQRGGSGKAPLVVVAPRLAFSGTVVDAAGLPAAGARVTLEAPTDLRGRLRIASDYSTDLVFATLADDRGRFAFGVPAIEGARLVASLDGVLPAIEPAPQASRDNLVLVLRDRDPADALLEGRVVDALGAPVPEALVSLGLDSARTDSDGTFRFHLEEEASFNAHLADRLEVDDRVLRALKPGHLPAELRAETQGERAVWPERIVLRLGGTPLSLRGRVLDEADRPQAGFRVWIDDPTAFGGLGDPRTESFPDLVHTETLLAGAEPGWRSVLTDAEGRFELDGLLDRTYRLSVMDPRTLARTDVHDVQAGRSGVQVRVSRDAYATLRGRVVDSRGKAVPDVLVRPVADAFRQRYAGQVVGTHHASADGVRTDAEGRFVLSDVPRDLVYLRLDGADVIPLSHGRGVEGGLRALVGEDPPEVVLTVGLRCHFQVELTVPGEADELAVLDGEGTPLTLSEFRGNGRRDGSRLALTGDRTNVLAVADTGRTLVLYREGEEVRRLPLHLTPGDPLQLRP